MRRHDVRHGHGTMHPETFTEVIARGFPTERLNALRDHQKAMVESRVLPQVLAQPLPEVTEVIARRDGNSNFPIALQAAFKQAVAKMVADGTYLPLVENHMDMAHDMHGSMGEDGLNRFLAWHRRYLVEFERELRRADAVLRPGAADKLSVPYWRWQDPFPTWLNGFLPQTIPGSGTTPPSRKNAAPPPKANAADIDIIVNQFAIQVPTVPTVTDYTKFTWGVEGWGLRPNGTKLPAHNHGHAWIGGIMNNTSTSPTDPAFWLHHAEVDRLWEIWRLSNPAPRPNLSGSKLIMDPWSESYDDLLDTPTLGYSYDSLSP